MTTPNAARSERELTFGNTPCSVAIRGGPQRDCGAAFVAHVFVVEEEGRALRRIGDRRGKPVVFDGHSPDEVLALAALYLERRFGRLRKAPVPDAGPRAARPIREPPRREE